MAVEAKKEDVFYYSPSVSVVVAVRQFNGESGYSWQYLDISKDVISCNVELKIDNESTFRIDLQNAGGKYTDFFHDMDKIQISCTKTGGANEPYTLLTGHIHSTDAFQLYGDKINIAGSCPIHNLRNHYWNTHSPSSYSLLEGLQVQANETGDPDLSIADTVIKTLICGIAGWSEDQLEISDVPEVIAEAAFALFDQNRDYITGTSLIAGDIESEGAGVTTDSTKADEEEKKDEKTASSSAFQKAADAVNSAFTQTAGANKNKS